MILKSLTTRVIGISILLLTVGISAFTYLNLKREQSQLVNSARENTDLVLQSVEASIYSSMRQGNVQDTQTVLEMVGKNPKLLAVRIFHPHGIILRSSDPAEVGRPIRDFKYQLFVNNKKEGTLSLPVHGEILTMLKPIYNVEPCFGCHGNKSRIIGVLNVDYSLADTRKMMVEGTQLFIISTVAIIIFLSLAISFVMLKFVKKPLRQIAENMVRVEQGDLSVRMKPVVMDEVGRLIGSFDSMVDRLDRAKQELEQLHFNQMERADRLASVGEMAAGIAHEVKNPLTGIAAAITIIRDDMSSGDPRSEILNEVLEQVKRLDKTVNDLLFFGKPTPPEPTFTDLNSVLSKTIKFASQHRAGKGDIIKRDILLQSDLPAVFVDPKQIQQVFLNLILNAFQAMPEGGRLTVKSTSLLRDEREWVVASIADTGPGIPEQILGKIFTPFFTTKAQGTGLGLAICHKLVSQQGGTISVHSEDGRGTEFIVELPSCALPPSGVGLVG